MQRQTVHATGNYVEKQEEIGGMLQEDVYREVVRSPGLGHTADGHPTSQALFGSLKKGSSEKQVLSGHTE